MKELIDLYAKLVIGTFTFIGPSFTLLISLFSRQVDKSKVKHNERLRNLAKLDNPNAELQKQIKKNIRITNLLNPKRQVVRLFGSLLASLMGIFFYYFQHSHFWDYRSQQWRIGALLVSALLFLYCLFTLWQLFCIIITAKLEEEEEKKVITQLLQTENP